MNNKCNELGPRLAGLVQQLNTVHTLFQQEKYREASIALYKARDEAEAASHDLFALHYVSGTGDHSA